MVQPGEQELSVRQQCALLQVSRASLYYEPVEAVEFCLQALEEALGCYGPPEVFNSDQGAQFTAIEFVAVLLAHEVRISMDGKGRALDNVFVERL